MNTFSRLLTAASAVVNNVWEGEVGRCALDNFVNHTGLCDTSENS